MPHTLQPLSISRIAIGCFALIAVGVLASCSGGNSGSGTSSSPQADTVAGLDTNSNGVRDDVEQYINTTYADPSQAETKAALTQYAQVLQSTIVDAATAANASAAAATTGTSAETAVRHLQEMANAFDCLGATRPDDFSLLVLALRDIVLETDAREQAYVTAQQQADEADAMNHLTFSNPNDRSAICR